MAINDTGTSHQPANETRQSYPQEEVTKICHILEEQKHAISELRERVGFALITEDPQQAVDKEAPETRASRSDLIEWLFNISQVITINTEAIYDITNRLDV